jgi:antitoxin (DNA-binding transcriptional repressor) of toxin-antitoxin stability system
MVEQGEELVVSRRNRPVARIVPIRDSGQKRIGLLAGHPFRMGEGFNARMAEALGDLFGVPVTEKK